MALNVEDALRVEFATVTKKDGSSYQSKRWIFACIDCGVEMRKQSHALKSHTGKCVRCSRRNRHPYQTIWNGFLSSVRRTNDRFPGRDVEVNMTFEDFLFLTQIGCCAYCNGPVQWAEYRSGAYNMDRVDNSKGYEIGNVVVCCFDCNNRKGKHWTGQEFHLISDLVSIWRSSDDHSQREIRYAISEWKNQVRSQAS